MRVLRSAYLSRVAPDSARAQTILAFLLWSGVTIFIFGILIDLFRCLPALFRAAAIVQGPRTTGR
jgi:hypothetical protein